MDLTPSSGLVGTAGMWYTDIHVGKTPIHIKFLKNYGVLIREEEEAKYRRSRVKIRDV